MLQETMIICRSHGAAGRPVPDAMLSAMTSLLQLGHGHRDDLPWTCLMHTASRARVPRRLHKVCPNPLPEYTTDAAYSRFSGWHHAFGCSCHVGHSLQVRVPDQITAIRSQILSLHPTGPLRCQSAGQTTATEVSSPTPTTILGRSSWPHGFQPEFRC